MKHVMPALAVAMSVAAPLVHAQQSGGDLESTQALGRHLLAQSCAVCHLPPTLGAKTYGPLLNTTTAAGNDEALRIVIANGSERMPAFKYYLKPAEIDAIIAYVRTLPAQATTASNEAQGASR
jgi:mono/diheme cytochrome c family protein